MEDFITYETLCNITGITKATLKQYLCHYTLARYKKKITSHGEVVMFTQSFLNIFSVYLKNKRRIDEIAKLYNYVKKYTKLRIPDFRILEQVEEKLITYYG